ncbi:MAG: 3-hydroxybutyryl-CoA dehydrogenase [Planctomycetes bacterium]|nr:3-hydroxybutyryl-CoA dehydrogenase [Planctomycetota bacterium]
MPEKLLVVGAGTMGAGIAQVSAQAGLATWLTDVSRDRLDRALDRIRKSLETGVSRAKITADDQARALANLQLGVEWPRGAGVDFVIEAVPERLELKAEIFRALDQAFGPEVRFASNTSSISITQLAATTARAPRFIGMHFFNPVPIMKLVEIIRGLDTSDETAAAAASLAEKLGKTAVVVRDFPGFVANRVLMPLLNEAFFAVMEGVAGPQEIDSIVKLGLHHPMGPLELADFVGLDVCLDVLQVLHRELGDPKYRPCPILVQMVRAGRLGRKTGRGFFTYEG